MFCIPKNTIDKFKRDLKSGAINFDKLMDMDSPSRRAYFNEYFGEGVGQQVNALFESKMILKYQKKGMVDWIKSVGGMKPEAKRDIISRINKMDKILDRGDQSFLEDLVAQRLGISVTMEEAANISEMSNVVEGKRRAMEQSERRTENGRPTQSEMEYGLSLVKFERYLQALHEQASKKKLSQKTKEYLKDPSKLVFDTAGLAKSMKGSLDNSFIGRQGIRLFYKGLTGDVASGKAWLDTFFKSFHLLYNGAKKKTDTLDAIRAEILSDPDYDLMKKAKVATTVVEEELPVHLPTKIPAAGRLFQASEDAFSGSAQYLRYRVFKNYLNIARKSGIDVKNKEQLIGIGSLTNALTGRAGVDARKPGLMNNVFWSPKQIKAHAHTMTSHLFDPNATPFVKKQAAINMLRLASGMAAILFMAEKLIPGSVEWDPRSSDFGKIRVGKTRFDISGGMASLITLAMRILPTFVGQPIKTKSTKTGKVKEIKAGRFGQSGRDVVTDFLGNKLSPVASLVDSIIQRQMYNGDKVTPITAAELLFSPIPVENFQEVLDSPEGGHPLAAAIADTFGISGMTYQDKKKKSSAKKVRK